MLGYDGSNGPDLPILLMARESSRRARRAAKFSRAMAHPLRVEILEAFGARGTHRSPSDLAEDLGEPLGNVSYHVTRLAKAGAIELDKTEPRRGAMEHFYRLTAAGARMSAVVRKL